MPAGLDASAQILRRTMTGSVRTESNDLVPVFEETISEVDCYVYQKAGLLNVGESIILVQEWKGFVPAGTDVKPLDKFVCDQGTFQVTSTYEATRGAVSHIELRLELIDLPTGEA